MAAVVQIHEMSASLTGTDKTSSTVRFKLADNSTIDAVNPITIPTSGATHSYSKQLRMYCATAPDTQIDNLKCYSDGSNTFGGGISVAASNFSASCGDPHVFVSNNQTVMTASVDFFGLTSGSPMDLDAYHTSAVTTTGYFGDFVKLMMSVDSTASPGTLSTETLTMAYDEI